MSIKEKLLGPVSPWDERVVAIIRTLLILFAWILLVFYMGVSYERNRTKSFFEIDQMIDQAIRERGIKVPDPKESHFKKSFDQYVF